MAEFPDFPAIDDAALIAKPGRRALDHAGLRV